MNDLIRLVASSFNPYQGIWIEQDSQVIHTEDEDQRAIFYKSYSHGERIDELAVNSDDFYHNAGFMA